MAAIYPEHNYVLGDIRDADSLHRTFVGHDGVIHAAAMKRIPECEQRPDECWKINVQGSYNVLRMAQAAKVQWCLGISTDKACAAVTCYGASKLMLECMYKAAWDMQVATKALLLRYGNVVASNGSVVPLWERQVAEGKPLTVTHANMTRFWLSPTDAVNLITQRVSHQYQSGILVPRVKAMGVLDLAHSLHPEWPVEIVGLRSAEKIHEDLIAPNELAREAKDFYVIDKDGQPGLSYTSLNAEKLTAADFMGLLADAADLEASMRAV
jgi:UDP-N-acetylglucosamine 4,6-dehydratase